MIDRGDDVTWKDVGMYVLAALVVTALFVVTLLIARGMSWAWEMI